MSTPPTMPPPPSGNRGPQMLAMFWIETIIAMIFLSLRLYVRYSIRGLGTDDWMMVATVILFTIMTGTVTKFVLLGGAKHVYDLTPPELLEVVKWSWIAQPWCIFLYATGKASVAFLILRIMGPNTKWRKWSLYFFIVTIFIVNGLACIITFVQCDPPRALWDPTVKGKCWDPNVQQYYNYFVAAWNMLTDVVLSLLPITIFWNMSIPIKKKVALCCLLSLGLLATICTGIKTRYLVELAERGVDFTWTLYSVQAWSAAEGFLLIVCGNIPPLQPLWDRFVTHKLDSNYNKLPSKSYLMSDPSSKSARSKDYPYHSASAMATDKSGSFSESDYGNNIYAKTEINTISTREIV